MPSNLLTACASIVGLLLITAGRADAQIVTVVPGYNPGVPGVKPPTSQPSGTYSLPAGTTTPWQVVVDWGTVSNGDFEQWNGAAHLTIVIPVPAGPGPAQWNSLVARSLLGKPNNLYVRARLQESVVFRGWVTRDTDLATCP